MDNMQDQTAIAGGAAVRIVQRSFARWNSAGSYIRV